ncbi:MAG: hypothetical protein NWF01_09745 [Candidatus Bathyarchaeota archaeon]|nr:hypothetical protein [Candidatus Bathyarchaeota archaeon]
MISEGQDDGDLKALNDVYDELSKDARTIASDLNESISAYYVLGFYLLAFCFGLNLYFIATRSLVLTDYAFVVVWIIFVNLIPITSGCLVLYRYFKLNKRYKMLFQLEKNIRIKEYKESKKNRTVI